MIVKVLKRVLVGGRIYQSGEEVSDPNAIRLLTKLRVDLEILEQDVPELADLKVDELRALAEERGLVHEGLKKAELVALLDESGGDGSAGESA